MTTEMYDTRFLYSHNNFGYRHIGYIDIPTSRVAYSTPPPVKLYRKQLYVT